MKARSLSLKIFVLLLAIVVLALLAPASVGLAESSGNPRVLPPSSTPIDISYGEWRARWWQWAVGQPASVSPLQDTTGEFCAVGQTGKVWFLAGTMFGGSFTRSCTIPADKAVYFPVANAFCTDVGTGATPEEMLECAKQYMDTATDLSAELDGVPFKNLESYRVRYSAEDFDLTLPPDNIFEAPAGVYGPTGADGIQLMLVPLSVGHHILHFHALFPGSDPIDGTYYLTIAPAAP
ncbi:MAG: hypothetical protein ACM3JD_08295 [Rudaea sp.]